MMFAAALEKDEILDQIFSYVGGGDHLYVAGIYRKWRGKYLQYCAQATTAARDKKCVTRHRSAIITKCRLQHAELNGFSSAGLDMTQDKTAELIYRHSLEAEQVVTVLRLHGVPWDHVICRKAAFFAKLSLLQWLHSNGCQWLELNVLVNASRGGSVPMLQWLQTVTVPWSSDTKQKMMKHTASCDELAAAQWLRARGAPGQVSFGVCTVGRC
jgi:hypothetical protein